MLIFERVNNRHTCTNFVSKYKMSKFVIRKVNELMQQLTKTTTCNKRKNIYFIYFTLQMFGCTFLNKKLQPEFLGN